MTRRSRCRVERHVGEQAAQQVEPVRAAVERDSRLEAERSDPRVDFGARDVRQVGRHDIGPGKPFAGGCQQIRRLEGDGLRDAVCRQVLRGQRERVGRDVTRDEPQPAVGDLAAEVQGKRKGNGTRSRGDVPGDRGRLPCESRRDLRGGGRDDELRLGSGDQGARIGSDPQRAPLLEAADVRDRLACRPAVDGGAEGVALLEAGLGMREQPRPVPPGHVRQKDLGVEPRGRLPGVAELRRVAAASASPMLRRRGDHPSAELLEPSRPGPPPAAAR